MTPAESLCFTGDTDILTTRGLKKIKDIEIGDFVLSYGRSVSWEEVIASKLTQEKARILEVTFSNGLKLKCTPNHPFAVKTDGKKIEYIPAKDLKKEHKFLFVDTNQDPTTKEAYPDVKLVSIEEAGFEDVYNIEVENTHNYYVGGKVAVLVHNCGLQVEQFRNKYGIIKGVSDRAYVSNSFHCGVWEDITPTQKQDLEGRFWDLFNGGKIQYCRYLVPYNYEAQKTLVRRAMDKGFYEGCNLALSYCEDCGYEQLEMDKCPKCGSDNICQIDRMNGLTT